MPDSNFVLLVLKWISDNLEKIYFLLSALAALYITILIHWYASFSSSRVFGAISKLYLSMTVYAALYLLINYRNGGDLFRSYLVLIIMSFASALYLLYLHYRQSNMDRDNSVNSLIKGSVDTLSLPLLLFLRPFITDGRLPIEMGPVSDSLSTVFALGINKSGGFESNLMLSLRKSFSLVRLDLGKEQSFWKFPITRIRAIFSYRIGRHVSKIGEDWKSYYHSLVTQAKVCIVVPPVYNGPEKPETHYEINYMEEKNLLYKAIFIMPQGRFKLKLFKTKITAKSLWNDFVSHFSKTIDLPPYNSVGGFVVPLADRYRLVNGLSGKPWYDRRVIKRILKGGCVVDSVWLDSLRITVKLGWVIPIFGTLATMAIIAYNDIHKFEIILLISVLVTLCAIRYYYDYCNYFLLHKKQRRLLFLSTIIALGIGLFIGIYAVNHLSDKRLFFFQDTFNISLYTELVYIMMWLLLPVSFFVYLSAFGVLCCRDNVFLDYSGSKKLDKSSSEPQNCIKKIRVERG